LIIVVVIGREGLRMPETLKKFIRSKTDKTLFKAPDVWVGSPLTADEFTGISAAIAARARYGLEDVELYYLVEDLPSKRDFAVTIP
jgi:hypothetical protein